MAIEKIKILGAVLELPAKQHCQFSPFGSFLQWIGWIFFTNISQFVQKDFFLSWKNEIKHYIILVKTNDKNNIRKFLVWSDEIFIVSNAMWSLSWSRFSGCNSLGQQKRICLSSVPRVLLGLRFQKRFQCCLEFCSYF